MTFPQRIVRYARRLGRRLFVRRPDTLDQALAEVNRRGDLIRWMAVIDLARSQLGAEDNALLDNHEFFVRSSAVENYHDEIQSSLGDWLREQHVSYSNLASVVPEVIRRIVLKKTVFQCRDDHVGGGYYDAAEPEMDWQWTQLVEPHIAQYDLSRTLELAPGHGRNSARLSRRAKELHLVDVNQTCINACRTRFGEESNGCAFHYYVNDGSSLRAIADESITFVYSFDSMVHFDKTVVRDYVVEFARILAPGGAGFVHHSNYGSVAPNSDWYKNPGSRSDMTAQLFRRYCEEQSLEVVRQVLHGPAEGRSIEGLDCVTVFRKPRQLASD